MGCVSIISRAGWGAAPPKSTPTKMAVPTADVVIHHSAGPCEDDLPQSEEAARLRSIQSLHQRPESEGGRNFNDIAYNFLVFPSGRAYEGRGWGIKGGHLFDPLNSTIVGICFVGQYDSGYPSPQTPTPEAIAACEGIIAEGLERGYISEGFEVTGHSDYQQKACPGDSLYALLSRFEEVDDVALTEEQEAALAFLADIKIGVDKKVAGGGTPPKDKEPDRFLGWKLAKLAGL